jgi:hypothetical protein
MDNLKKYIDRKARYIILKSHQYTTRDGLIYGDLKYGGGNSKLIFLAGYAASGKSTMSEKFKKKGYHIISTDEVIKYELIPMFVGKIEGQRLFSVQLYDDKYSGDKVWVAAREKFLEILKNKVEEGMNKYGKVLVEGQLRIRKDIRFIFGEDDDFALHYVMPASIESYADRMTSRVLHDPDRYGRLANLKSRDKDGSLRKDLLENGKDGELWRPFIMQVSKELFHKHQRGADELIDAGFEVKIFKN